MTDKEIIEAIARLWVNLGGDEEGFCWVWGKIRDRIREIINENS